MIPKNLMYDTKVNSSSSRSWKANLPPSGASGPFKANDVITINIPTGQNLVTVMSENYLKFDVTFTFTAANAYLRWDSHGAHGLINRLRISHGSNLLEDTEDYSALAKMLFDIQVNTSSAYGKYNILCGTRADYVANMNAVAGADATALANRKLTVRQVNSGERIGQAGAGSFPTFASTDTITKTYCLSLISLCGTLCDSKYFPLFECSNLPLKLEIFLQPSTISAICTKEDVTTFSLSNVEYIANMIELSDNAISTIRSSLNGNPLQFVIPQYRSYNFSGQVINKDGTSSFSIPIAAKYASLKAIFVMIRDSTKPAKTFFPISSHTFNLIDYTFKIGAKTVPAKAPATYPEMYAELVKAIGSLSDLRYNPSIEMLSYCGNACKSETTGNVNDATKAQSYGMIPTANDDSATEIGWVSSGSFYIGLDCESYSNADKSQIFTGLNTTNSDVTLNANFYGLTAAAVSVRFTSFANFDATLIFENGSAFLAL